MSSLREERGTPADFGALGEVFGTLNVEQIRGVLPHRYPFLLVDRICPAF